uniref:BRICHOS domain containing 5 n=1 Tax=Bubo bubo TaxID=30461 RepID=A0A8C0F5J2_BUBBB
MGAFGVRGTGTSPPGLCDGERSASQISSPPAGQSFSPLLNNSRRATGTSKGAGWGCRWGDAVRRHQTADGWCCPPSLCAQAGSQLVRLTLQGQQDPLRNQTALVDKSRSTVTYYVTSQSNHTAVVLYDSRNVSGCFFQADELLRQNNQTKYYREFMGILAGEQVDPKSLGEAVQALCEQTSIFWVRRGEGKLSHTSLCRRGKHDLIREPWLVPTTCPGKQRLIYLCIDICFPSNICVSICFYYLPE